MRALALGDQTIDKLSRISLGQFKQALERANSPRQRVAIGIIWAQRLADAATTKRDLDAALFRFAQHLRASASSAFTPRANRKTLEFAAHLAFAQLRDRPLGYRRYEPPDQSELPAEIWSIALGHPRTEWASLVTDVGAAIRAGSPQTAAAVPVEIPKWLSPPPAERASARLLEVAPWQLADDANDVHGSLEDLPRAYGAFVTNDWANASELAAGTRQSMGRLWAPNESVEGRALFAWLRALPLLDLIFNDGAAAGMHHLLSSIELLSRVADGSCQETVEALLERVPAEPSGDHAADLDWAAVRYRMCRALGHEIALADLANPTKARLRALWRQAHPDLPFADETTFDFISVLDSPFAQALTNLGRRAADDLAGTHRAIGVLEEFATGPEREVLGLVATAVLRHSEVHDGARSMQALLDLGSLLVEASDEVRLCGSLLLQEACLPLLTAIRDENAQQIERLSSAGGPAIVAHLLTDRLPLLCPEGTELELELLLRNEGTMAARDLSVGSLTSEAFLVGGTGDPVGDIPAGAERRVKVTAETRAVCREAAIDVSLSWTDDFDRERQMRTRFNAEAERESRWTPADRNPFQLSSIEDPDRLIGRDVYIEAFLNAARSGASMYVTGLKRVGKTSLVRVGLKLLESEGALAVYLPLGRALGPTPGAADLVVAMLEKLSDAAQDANPDVDVPAFVAPPDDASFPRTADRWLSRLHRVLPRGTRGVIALDDFDELPVHLRSGPEADALFLFLRSLIDEDWLSLTFIGSEVLPTLLSSQSQRLNQVDPMIVENFGSREETGQLLARPSSDRIDWTDEAVDLVHALTEGNPYYATIIGSRVWTHLRERARTLAQVSDVGRAVDDLARTENPSHFMHLWSDDPEGLDAASPRAIRSSAVLRSVARCSSTPGAQVARQEVVAVAQEWIPGSTSEQLHETCSGLVRRGVLDEREPGAVRLRIPVVGRWLLAAGSRHLDEVYRDSALARPATRVVTAADYVQLARGLEYQGRTVGAVDLQGWVEQLPDPSHRYLAFQVLKRVCTAGYFSQSRLQTEVVPKLVSSLRLGPLNGRELRATNGYLTRVLLLDHGARGSSAPALQRMMLTHLRLAKGAVTPIDEVAERVRREEPSLVLVVDEFAGSGSQITRVVDELATELSSLGQDWNEQVAIGVGLGVVAGPDAEASLADRPCEVAIGVRLSNEVKAFDDGSDVFESDSDREAAKDLFAAIGRSLSVRPALGYRNQGLLVVFESNCPNNSLPALWKTGTYGGRDWNPVFQRLDARTRNPT